MSDFHCKIVILSRAGEYRIIQRLHYEQQCFHTKPGTIFQQVEFSRMMLLTEISGTIENRFDSVDSFSESDQVEVSIGRTILVAKDGFVFGKS